MNSIEVIKILNYIEKDILGIYDELEGEGIYNEYIENKIGDILEMIREIKNKGDDEE